MRTLPFTGDQILFHSAVTFEHTTSLKRVKRVDYSILQWGADVGGLYHIIFKVSTILLTFLIGDSAQMFVGTHLMAKKDKEPEKNG